MPEISDAEYRNYVRYQSLGTPEEVERKIRDLEKDNRKQREEIREASEKLKGLPKETEVVVPKEKAELLERYEKLGKVEDLEKASGELETLRQKDAQRTREDAMRAAAQVYGYDFDVLKDLPGAAAGTFEVKKEKDGDREVEVAYFTPGEKDAKPVKLTEHVDSAWGKFKPALEANADQDRRGGGSTERAFARQSGQERMAGGKKTEDDFRRAVEATADYQL